jgi:Polysaccharide deacetylase.
MRDLYFTFDYELFFGRRVGTVTRCLLEPTEQLLQIARKTGVRFTFFIDAGMLAAMRREAKRLLWVRNDQTVVAKQIETMAREGHSVQLHVHPHWEDTIATEDGWQMNVGRYNLNAFSSADIHRIIGDYKALIGDISGASVHAFRGGGLCIQPFSKIGPALAAHGIRIDSSVFCGGKMKSSSHDIDFSSAPRKSRWRFSDDPCLEQPDGIFEEYSIAPLHFSPLFFWHMAWIRIRKSQKYNRSGDGQGLVGNAGRVWSALLRGSNDMASSDGFRVSRLESAYSRFRSEEPDAAFVVIGHPKLSSQASFEVIEHLARSHAPQISTL